ncbi:cell division protein FtsA [Chitinispirillales bacterium ANBcel5]|uniref:cell division protein FtsA n=1 Tax=Cellulosispirillum alkaliphilum TaxID=3039283 RepID=UPI002A4FDF8E|nr:cell division protein FtsA [Chitinispirillales bacterium ANBcel5]
MEDNVFVGLDIGTTKIACIISELDSSGELKIVGVGVSPSDGLRKGVVVNIDKTVRSIQKAVEEAELMAGVDVDSVWVGIAGDHIRAINSKGVVAISRDDNEITELDVVRAIDAAKAVSIPMDREILHVIPQEFIVDDQKGIKDPIGMCGVRLETQVHIITGAVTSAQNIFKSVDKAGLKVIDLVLEPLASCYSVLENDEKELGVALLDMGGGTTDIAIYFDESIRHTAVVGLGGKNVTSDIAIGIRTPVDRAEEIKKQYGCAYTPLVKGDEFISVPGVGGREQREVSKAVLASIIEPRMEEILSLALREIKRTDYSDMLGAGVVLTGGGSLMEGVQELAEKVFEMPVKLGLPDGFGGLTEAAKSPLHSTGIGLCMYGKENFKTRKGKKSLSGEDNFKKILDRMKTWVKEFF